MGGPCTLNAVLSLRWGMRHCRERPTTRNRTRDNSYQGICHGGPSGQPLSLPTSDVYAKHLPSFFAGISGLGKEVPCSLVPAGDQKPVLERNDSAYEEWSQRSPSSPKQSSDMVDKLSDTKPVLCLVCIFRQEPDIPIDASALKKLSTSGQILSVDPVAGKVLSTIRDGWQVESGP